MKGNANKLTLDEAKKLAEEELGKYEYIIAEVDEKDSIICSTGLPLEEKIREPLESIVTDFLDEFGIEDDDTAAFIGAKFTTEILSELENRSGIGIICSYKDY